MSDDGAHSSTPGRSARAAEDLVDAATGLDGRAWVTLRDLVLRPWSMIQRAAFEHDRAYVGAVKLSLAMSTLAIVVMSWLVPNGAYLDPMRTSNPDAWRELLAQLDAHGVCVEHFSDRYTSRHELLNTFATLLECTCFAAIIHRMDRARPFMSHLSFVLYCYALWLLITVPLQFIVMADLGDLVRAVAGVGVGALLPGLLIQGLRRLYPAPWTRQLLRGAILVVVTVVLFTVMVVAISWAAMAWAKASFGLG